MKTYRVEFTPISPYFFGNEKTFSYPGQKVGNALRNQYYIKSERMPSQTTILGALRYLFLAHKNADYTYTEAQFSENAARVGKESFDISRDHEQDFGTIHGISPVFLYHKKDGILIPTPFDHNAAGDNEKYTPFSHYGAVETPDGEKLYTEDYDAKIGLTDSFMKLKDASIISSDSIFDSECRVGIAVGKKSDGFFKKNYVMLKKGYSFSVYLTLTDENAVDALKKEYHGAVSVFMGQGKSAFLVSFTEDENTVTEQLRVYLKRNIPQNGKVLYFLSDAVLSDSTALYESTLFAAVKTKDHRAFHIEYEDVNNKQKIGRVGKRDILYQLISAGSVLIVSDTDRTVSLFQNANAQKIGLNQIVK